MASLIWGGIFIFLLLELAVTFVLTLPVPRKLRNWLARNIIFRLELGTKLAKPTLFVGLALALVLVDSYFAHARIVQRMHDEHAAAGGSLTAGMMAHDAVYHTFDKEKKYKAERNMYLAGFSLTLLFVIGRITTLMQESIESEEEMDRVRKFVKAANHIDESSATSVKETADKKKGTKSNEI